MLMFALHTASAIGMVQHANVIQGATNQMAQREEEKGGGQVGVHSAAVKSYPLCWAACSIAEAGQAAFVTAGGGGEGERGVIQAMRIPCLTAKGPLLNMWSPGAHALACMKCMHEASIIMAMAEQEHWGDCSGSSMSRLGTAMLLIVQPPYGLGHESPFFPPWPCSYPSF